MAEGNVQRSELQVAIVNWRTPALTVDCLRSIASERSRITLDVIVVDNASGDGSDEKLDSAIRENGWQGWVRLIRAERNGGFAYGNNLAIRAALKADPGLRYVLLLNPDTLVRPGAFREIVDFMNSHPEAGLAGGISEDLDGTRQHCCFRFPSALNEFASYLRLGIVDKLLKRWVILDPMPERPAQTDWVSGAHLIVRREVIEQVGLLDEGYFLYFEETDYILQARRAGWSCWHVPASRIVHFDGKSSGINTAHGAMKAAPPYWFESRRRYFTLNHGRIYAVAADLAMLAGVVLWKARCVLQGKQDIDPPNLISGLMRHGAIVNGKGSLKPRTMHL